MASFSKQLNFDSSFGYLKYQNISIKPECQTNRPKPSRPFPTKVKHLMFKEVLILFSDLATLKFWMIIVVVCKSESKPSFLQDSINKVKSALINLGVMMEYLVNAKIHLCQNPEDIKRLKV